MTKRDQRRLASDLITALRETVNRRLKKVPEEWDGIELREWISDLAKENMVWKDSMTRGRKMCYRNTRLVKNI